MFWIVAQTIAVDTVIADLAARSLKTSAKLAARLTKIIFFILAEKRFTMHGNRNVHNTYMSHKALGQVWGQAGTSGDTRCRIHVRDRHKLHGFNSWRPRRPDSDKDGVPGTRFPGTAKKEGQTMNKVTDIYVCTFVHINTADEISTVNAPLIRKEYLTR